MPLSTLWPTRAGRTGDGYPRPGAARPNRTLTASEPAMMTQRSIVLALPLVLLASAGQAQEMLAAPEPAVTPPPPPGQTDLLESMRLSVRTDGSFSLQSDQDEAGESSVSRWGAGADADIRLSTDVFATLSYSVELSFYDFDGATSLTPDGDPVDSTYEHTISAALRGQISPRWGWFGGGGVKLAAEAGAGSASIARPLAFGGASYRFSDALSVGLGVGVVAELERDLRWFPAVHVDWQINRDWRLTAGQTIITEGPAVGIFYRATEQVELFFGGGYDYREYRMDDEGPAPEGVFRDKRVPILVGADWKPTPNIRVTAAAGVTVFQEYEILDQKGTQIGDDESDPSGTFGVRLSASF